MQKISLWSNDGHYEMNMQVIRLIRLRQRLMPGFVKLRLLDKGDRNLW